jgi:septum site-determining protein MinC
MIAADHSLNLQIKGIREGLLVTVGEGDWPDLEQSLLAHIEHQENFFRGARVALEIGNHVLRAAELGALRDKLADHGVTLWAVISNSPTTEQNAQTLGLGTRLSAPKPERAMHKMETTLDGEAAIFVPRTLRSGFKVSYEGNVVVVGDVNAGAEIEATGSVMIWGKLRGAARAGINGDAATHIYALEMNSAALRIADVDLNYSQPKGKNGPQVASIQNGQIVVQNWEHKEK